ncbi:metal ABC transporter permease [Plastoroseomonas hellenica]|uniref:Metal ABC transporter permease n=1 Tax=Plastoroseomonas hellenica TaxID=2687306 RepID=A0ABS5F1Y4_9PROT|nr:metal ABC transporter permease [Plastoroseomonas hellenica]MBR0646285.1 metal ABC transporter permease [Plastoroseomonas hellenica]MBR0666603.1 metal ABC transporter permease [Plastoroseomonas hellenica]
MTESLLIPFDYEYMRNAMWVSALVGGVCGLLSCFVALKGWSLLGDALSHAVVPGVAVAWMLGLPFALGAFASGLAAAWLMVFIRRNSRIREDAVIGVVFTAFFGLGLVLLSLFPSNIRLQTIVFGNVLGIAQGDILQMLIIAGGVLAVMALRGHDLMLWAFDAAHARAIGLNTALLQALLLGCVAAVAVAAMVTVGAVLVIAMLVAPGATAYLLTDRFRRMLAGASAMGAGTAFAGAYLSYFLDGSTGGVIVSLQALIFVAVLILAPRHGLLAGRRARRAAQATLQGAA